MILKTVDSTNAEIKRRLDSGQIMAQSAHGAWISALSQTAGRGRQGRSWISNEGGLYLSVLLQTDTMTDATWIPLMAAASVVTLLNGQSPTKPITIKWPNDIYVEGVKLGGILVEGMGSSTGKFSFIVGIGLNVNDSPQDIDQPTSNVKKYLPEFDLAQFRLDLVKKILTDFESLQSGNINDIRERYLKNSFFTPGVEVTWESLGEPIEQGQVVGIGEQGQLIVKTRTGESRALYAADVKIRRVL